MFACSSSSGSSTESHASTIARAVSGSVTQAAYGRARVRLCANPAAVIGLAAGGPRPARSYARDYVDIGGTHHLSWVHSSRRHPAVRQRPRQANVTKDGRLDQRAGRPVKRRSTAHVGRRPAINAEAERSTADEGKWTSKSRSCPPRQPLVGRADPRRRRSPTVRPSDARPVPDGRGYPARLADNGQRRKQGLVIVARRSTPRRAACSTGAASSTTPTPATPRSGSSTRTRRGRPEAGTQRERRPVEPGCPQRGDDADGTTNAHVYTDVNDEQHTPMRPRIVATRRADGSYSIPVHRLTSHTESGEHTTAPMQIRLLVVVAVPDGSFSWQN